MRHEQLFHVFSLIWTRYCTFKLVGFPFSGVLNLDRPVKIDAYIFSSDRAFLNIIKAKALNICSNYQCQVLGEQGE